MTKMNMSSFHLIKDEFKEFILTKYPTLGGPARYQHLPYNINLQNKENLFPESFAHVM
jgi:hypothetical protein